MFKAKRHPKKVVAYFDNYEGHSYVREIDVPQGYRFKPSFSGAELISNEGEIERQFAWRAGYSVEYEYIYD